MTVHEDRPQDSELAVVDHVAELVVEFQAAVVEAGEALEPPPRPDCLRTLCHGWTRLRRGRLALLADSCGPMPRSRELRRTARGAASSGGPGSAASSRRCCAARPRLTDATAWFGPPGVRWASSLSLYLPATDPACVDMTEQGTRRKPQDP